jgi:predicted nuclease with TOPRIM domain
MTTKIATYNDIDIFVTDKGVFFANVGEREFRRTLLNTLKKDLSKLIDPVDAICIYGYDAIRSFRRVRAIVEDFHDIRDADTGELIEDSKLYFPNPEVEAALENIAESYLSLRNEQKALLEKLEKLDFFAIRRMKRGY